MAFGKLRRLSVQNLSHAISLATACLISYWIVTRLLHLSPARGDDLIGGMWAAISAAFVFRRRRADARSAALTRFGATVVSFMLCLVYLSFVRPSVLGMAIVLVAGACVLQVLRRPDEIITMAITSIVVMVVAIINPTDAVKQRSSRSCGFLTRSWAS
jgi:uncharacterized membrane protein YccC